MEEIGVAVPTHPNKQRFTNDVIFRHKTPVAAIFRIMAIIAHHPVVVHFKGIGVWSYAVDVNVASFYLHFIAFIHLDGTFVYGEGDAGQFNWPTSFRNDDGAVVIGVPFVVGQLEVR